MKAVNALMKKALLAVENHLVANPETLEVPKEYDGYAASFCASVISSGLFPTLSFYTDIHKRRKDAQEEQGAVRRYKLLQALYYIVQDEAETGQEIAVNALQQWAMSEAFESDISNPAKQPWGLNRNTEAVLQKNIINAAIALKLALRNFPQQAAQQAAEN